MHIDWVLELPPSGAYENIVTVMDMLPRYPLAYLTSSHFFEKTARSQSPLWLSMIITDDNNLSQRIRFFISRDKRTGWSFRIYPTACYNQAGRNNWNAWLKTLLLKKSLKVEKSEQIILRHKFVDTSVLKYYRFYHASVGRKLNTVFHGRILYNVLEFEKGNRPQEASIRHSHVGQDAIEQVEMIFQDVCRNSMQTYIKYTAHFDKKMLQNLESDSTFMF